MKSISTSLFSKFGLFYFFSTILITLLILVNQIALAGLALNVILVLSFLYCLFNTEDGAYHFVVVILVFAPFLGFLRQYVFSYNGNTYILLMSLFLWLIKNPRLFTKVIFQKKQLSIIIFISFFILYGLILGSSLSRFMKFVETMLAFLTFSLFFTKIKFFTRTNIYFIFSSILLVLSLTKNAETRFIFEDATSTEIKADPGMLSIGLVLSALLIIVDNGIWVAYFRYGLKKWIKYLLLILIIVLLVITTSRIGFFTLGGCLLIWAILKKSNIKAFIPVSLLIIFSFGIIMNSQYAELAELWFSKTFQNEQGIAGATTGRANQWEMTVEYVKNDDLYNILFGYGPGKAPEFSKVYSTKIDAIDSIYGKAYELHSLYLNILVEFGLIAFILFILFIFKRFRTLLELSKMKNIDFPLIVLFGYLIYIFSVSGLGVIPGIMLSLFVNNFRIPRLKSSIYVRK